MTTVHPAFFEKYLPTTTITGLCYSVSKGPCQASRGLNTSSNHDSFRDKSKTLIGQSPPCDCCAIQIMWISSSLLESQLWEILNLGLITSHLPKLHGEKSLYTTTERGQNTSMNRNRDKKPRETSSHVSPAIQLYPKSAVSQISQVYEQVFFLRKAVNYSHIPQFIHLPNQLTLLVLETTRSHRDPFQDLQRT